MREEIIEGCAVSPQQAHLWQTQRDDNSQVFRARCAVLIEGGVDTHTLAASLQRVLDKHEILRTTFSCLPGMSIPVQVVNDDVRLSIAEHDVSDRGEPEQETFLRALSDEEDRRPLDFRRGPLLHASLVVLSPSKSVLLLTLPALCAGATTLSHLVEESARA